MWSSSHAFNDKESSGVFFVQFLVHCENTKEENRNNHTMFLLSEVHFNDIKALFSEFFFFKLKYYLLLFKFEHCTFFEYFYYWRKKEELFFIRLSIAFKWPSFGNYTGKSPSFGNSSGKSLRISLYRKTQISLLVILVRPSSEDSSK